MKLTKGDCYALMEFFDALSKHNIDTVRDICDAIGQNYEQMVVNLGGLTGVLDGIISVDKILVPDNEQTATIARIEYIPESQQER